MCILNFHYTVSFHWVCSPFKEKCDTGLIKALKVYSSPSHQQARQQQGHHGFPVTCLEPRKDHCGSPALMSPLYRVMYTEEEQVRVSQQQLELTLSQGWGRWVCLHFHPLHTSSELHILGDQSLHQAESGAKTALRVGEKCVRITPHCLPSDSGKRQWGIRAKYYPKSSQDESLVCWLCPGGLQQVWRSPFVIHANLLWQDSMKCLLYAQGIQWGDTRESEAWPLPSVNLPTDKTIYPSDNLLSFPERVPCSLRSAKYIKQRWPRHSTSLQMCHCLIDW
jgi:hypothetical protein